MNGFSEFRAGRLCGQGLYFHLDHNLLLGDLGLVFFFQFSDSCFLSIRHGTAFLHSGGLLHGNFQCALHNYLPDMVDLLW